MPTRFLNGERRLALDVAVRIVDALHDATGVSPIERMRKPARRSGTGRAREHVTSTSQTLSDSETEVFEGRDLRQHRQLQASNRHPGCAPTVESLPKEREQLLMDMGAACDLETL